MPISSSGIAGIIISIIIVILAIIIVIITVKSKDLQAESNDSAKDLEINDPNGSSNLIYTSDSSDSLVKRPTPWTKYKSPFNKKYIDNFSILSTSVRQAYTLESIKSTLAAKTIIDLYNDHLTNSFAKWHTRTYVYPKGMIIFKAISNKMPDEIDIGYGRKAILLKDNGKILATFPNMDVDIRISSSNTNKSTNDNNSVLIDNDSWYNNFGAKYFKAEANNRSNPILPILPPNSNCCRDDDGRTGGGWIYKDNLWSDYRNKLTKVQSDTELSRRITKSELKDWYKSNKFKFIPNTTNIQTFNASGNIEIPYFPVAMYMIVESKDSTEKYTINDIKKYITPISDENLNLEYLKSKVVEMKNHLETRHFNHIFPIGSIVFFITNDPIKTFKEEGNSFILCDGSSYKSEDYSKLSNIIGSNLINEFKVPNLINKIIVVGDNITGGSETESISGIIKSTKYDILKQLPHNGKDETNNNKSNVISRFNQELSKRGAFASNSTNDDKKMYGLITGPTDIWYSSDKLGTQIKPLNSKGLNQILSNATIEFDKKMINHLYVIPYIVADAF